MSETRDVSTLSTEYLRSLQKQSSVKQPAQRPQVQMAQQSLSQDDIIKIANAVADRRLMEYQQTQYQQNEAFEKISARANQIKTVVLKEIEKISEVYTLAWLRDHGNQYGIKLPQEMLTKLSEMEENAMVSADALGDAIAEGDYKDQMLTQALIEAAAADPEMAAQLIEEESPEDAMSPEDIREIAQQLAEAKAIEELGGEGVSEEEVQDVAEKTSSIIKLSQHWSELTCAVVSRMSDNILYLATLQQK